MNIHGLYGMPVSQDEAKNQFNEICLLKARISSSELL